VIVDCDSFKVPFAYPDSGLVWGTRSSYTDAMHGATITGTTRIAPTRWSEATVVYWLIMVVPLLGIAVGAIDWFWTRFRVLAPRADPL
jgi:hypothetical protein